MIRADSFQDIELVVDSTAVEHVEDLEVHTSVEDDDVSTNLVLVWSRGATIQTEGFGPSKVEKQSDCQMAHALSQYHLAHAVCYEWRLTSLRGAFQGRTGGRSSSKSKQCKICDETHPEESRCIENRAFE